jgi:hypothetical protein
VAKDVDSLTIVMEGREHENVPLASYATFIKGTVAILNALDPHKTLLWRVSAASLSSPLEMTATAEAPKDEFEPHVVDHYLDALRAAETGFVPRSVSPVIVSRARRLLSVVLENGVGSLEIRSPGRAPVKPRPRAEEKVVVTKGQRWDYEDLTELEGMLEIVSKHNGHKFAIFDTLTRRKTECIVSREQLNQALDTMKREFPRVSVFGKARYDSEGHPVEIVVESFEDLPGFDEVIDPTAVQGINITDGVDSVDYIRSLRDAE